MAAHPHPTHAPDLVVRERPLHQTAPAALQATTPPPPPRAGADAASVTLQVPFLPPDFPRSLLWTCPDSPLSCCGFSNHSTKKSWTAEANTAASYYPFRQVQPPPYSKDRLSSGSSFSSMMFLMSTSWFFCRSWCSGPSSWLSGTSLRSSESHDIDTVLREIVGSVQED